MTYLHVLAHTGERLALLSIRKPLAQGEHRRLVSYIENANFDAEMVAYTEYLALPGKPSQFGQKKPPERFRGVGVLSAYEDLNRLPRFEGSGSIKAESIPKQLRGEALLDYLDSLTRVTPPPTKPGNLKPAWTADSAPRKARTITADQLDKASKLRGQGVAWHKVAGIVGAAKSSLMDAMSGMGSGTLRNAI